VEIIIKMANKKARQYSSLTIKKLYALSGNKCAFPECPVIFLNSEDDVNFSNICHIQDANQNLFKSDRYNSKMTDLERADYKNLILLCPTHHIETNDVNKYSVASLCEMKQKHETKILQSLSGQNIITKYPSALNIVIGYLGTNILSNLNPDENLTAPDTEEKIKYNNVVIYRHIIEEYKIYQGRLSKIYEEIEKQGSSKKEVILQNIKTIYLKEKGNYSGIDEIRNNADKIIKNVENELWQIIENSQNINSHMPFEAIQISLLIILVDAFMRCNILEEPKKQ
jgi:hypothetical protein